MEQLNKLKLEVASFSLRYNTGENKSFVSSPQRAAYMLGIFWLMFHCYGIGFMCESLRLGLSFLNIREDLDVFEVFSSILL